MASKGVILVRPDDHIGWSMEIDAVENIVQQVERGLSSDIRGGESIFIEMLWL